MVLGSRTDVDDVVQTAWAQVAVAAEWFEGRSTVRTWLTSIVRHAAFNHRRRVRSQVLDPEAGARVTAGGDAFGAADDAILVAQLIAALPDEQRSAVELVNLQGYSLARAAGLLAVSEGAVKSRLRQARATIAPKPSVSGCAPDLTRARARPPRWGGRVRTGLSTARRAAGTGQRRRAPQPT